MKLDDKLIGGLLMGIAVGVYYHGALITYLPIFTILTLVLVLKFVHR